MQSQNTFSASKNNTSRLDRWLSYLFVFPLLGLMLVFPQTAASGAMNGLVLWSQTLLPVLLPFLIISGLLVTLKLTHPLNHLFSPVLCRIFPVSQAACYPLLIGLLCGMPLGAKTTADLYRSGHITEQDAKFLLGFSNQASLMFIISYVTTKELAAPAYTALYLSIIYLTGFIVSGCFLHFSDHKKKILKEQTLLISKTVPSTDEPLFFQALDSCIIDGFATITKIGGYVILFSMLAAFTALLPLPDFLAALAGVIMEITSGIHKICAGSIPPIQKTALTIGITAFGGISGILQTRSVTLGSGLSIRYYILVKLTHGVLAGLVTFIISNWLLPF